MKLFDFFNISKPGKGVEKTKERENARTDFKGFFTMYGRKFWNISNLNLAMAVYILVVAFGIWQLSAHTLAFYIFLGVVTLLFGLVNVASTYVTRGYVRGDPVYIFSDMKYAVKNNLFQGIILGVIDVVIIFLLIFDIIFWSGIDLNHMAEIAISENQVQSEQVTDNIEERETKNYEIEQNDASQLSAQTETVPNSESVSVPEQQKGNSFFESLSFYTCLFLLIVYSFMRCYIYLIAVTFKLSIFKIFKNAFIFAFLGIKRNILAILGIFAVCFINFYIFACIPMVGILLPLIITLGTCTFIGSYAAYPVIKKYMITPYYKDEEVYESYDRIFEDRG